MPTISNVRNKLKDPPRVGPSDAHAVEPLIREVIRLWREHKNYIRTKDRRHFVEVLAFLHLRISQSQRQAGIGAFPDRVGTCVEHLAHCDCPAQETIQLQVIAEGALYEWTQKFKKDKQRGKAKLAEMENSIVALQVADVRKLYETAERMHSQVMNYLVECSKQVNQYSIEVDQQIDDAEILASMESVMPRKGHLYWMELSEDEKRVQLSELSDIVMGIRVFNKCKGKGSLNLQQPHEQFEIESDKLSQRVDDVLKLVNDRIKGYINGILLYVEQYGRDHIFIQRLRDELAYSTQARIYLEGLSTFLKTGLKIVHDYCESSTRRIDRVFSLIETRKCIPAELVYPEFRKIGNYHKCVAEDYSFLVAHVRAATPVLDLAEKPCFIQLPFTARRLEIKAKNFLFLPREEFTKDHPIDSIVESGGPPPFIFKDVQEDNIPPNLQYNGYCPVTLVRLKGVLRRGDLKIGLIQLEDRVFSFADEDALYRFVKAPQAFMEGVGDVVLRLPHLIHILNLQDTWSFSFLCIPSILYMMPPTLPNDFGVQTCLHPLPEHSWDEETLQKRVEALANKQTDSIQTCDEVSHFHRASITQVWPPKDKWTQTGVSTGTTMPRYVRVLHNVRGEVHQDFKVVKSTYEWPGRHPG